MAAGMAGDGAVAAVPTCSPGLPAGCIGAPQRMQKFALGTLANWHAGQEFVAREVIYVRAGGGKS
jgi:hypothetical protein